MNVSIIRLLLLLGIFVTPPLCYAQSQPGGAQESGDQRLLAGLRQRRLFNLAALYCQRHLADPELTAQRRATLAIEMIKTLADRALHASPADRQAHWKEADQGVAAFNEQLRESPRHVLIQIQGALLWRTRGEALLHEAQMLDSAAADLQRARGYLRQASTQLAAAQQVIARLLRTAGRNNAAETLATTELMTLERNVSFQLACCYRATALCYPKQSDDWLNALSLARERLEPLAELSVAEETIWQARVERIRCLRLLGEAAQAHAAVDKLMKNNPPAQVKLAARSEQIRLALAEKNVTAALALAKQPRSEQGVGWPELDLAHLEAILTALRTAQQSGDTADRDRWQQQAASQVALIEREDGPYWMRRAETLLAAEVAGSAGGDVSAMQRAAESFFRGGRFEEALRAFDQASANAIERGNAAKAFELAFVAATIEHENQRHAEAAHRYLTLARMLPKNQRAAEAHLLAIVNWAQVVRDLPAEQRGAAIGQYDQLLREHLERWPEQESAHQASIWLGDLLRARREWQAAIDLFQKVPAQSKHYQEGARGAAECFVRLIEQLKAAGEPFEPTAAAAVAYLDDIVLGRERKWPQQFNRLQQDAALASAKIRLGHSQGTVADAGRLLQEAIARSPDATEAWRDEARILSVYALAADARRAEAAAALDAVASGSTEMLL